MLADFAIRHAQDLPLILGVGGWALVGRRRCGHMEEVFAQGEFLAAHAIPEEPVIANPVEARRQHVQEKAPNELHRRKGHRLHLRRRVGAIVLVPEAHLAFLQIEQALV